MFMQQQKIVCTKCGSDEVYIDSPELDKTPNTITIDDMASNTMCDLVYRPIIWKCKKCGYSVSK